MVIYGRYTSILGSWRSPIDPMLQSSPSDLTGSPGQPLWPVDHRSHGSHGPPTWPPWHHPATAHATWPSKRDAGWRLSLRCSGNSRRSVLHMITRNIIIYIYIDVNYYYYIYIYYIYIYYIIMYVCVIVCVCDCVCVRFSIFQVIWFPASLDFQANMSPF